MHAKRRKESAVNTTSTSGGATQHAHRPRAPTGFLEGFAHALEASNGAIEIDDHKMNVLGFQQGRTVIHNLGRCARCVRVTSAVLAPLAVALWSGLLTQNWQTLEDTIRYDC
jgi:hypothetical protein